jgi:hypothetical protein
MASLAVVSQMPVYMGCVEGPEVGDVLADACWDECLNCGCVQLHDVPDPALVYLMQHNEVVGATWQRHHESFAAFIASYSPRRIVEIGGAHGWLAEHYTRRYAVDDWLVIEPNPTFGESGRIRVEKAFIEDVPNVLEMADAVVHSHVLEHVLEPQSFLSLIASRAEEGDLQLISVPSISRLLELDGANALNFEHTYSFDRRVLEWLLQANGYRVLEVVEFEQHSFFVAAERAGDLVGLNQPPKQDVRDAFLGVIQRSGIDVQTLNQRLKTIESDRVVFIHGAHVFTQFLVSQGLDVRRISRVVDNAVGKQGKRLYGTPLCVGSMEEIASSADPVLIVRATHYADEVIAQARNLNPRVEIW